MAKIFLSVPVLDKPELNFVHSVYQAILTCKEHQVRLYWNLNDSLISRVRCVHISNFYYDFPECDYFMSLDSDIEIVNCYPNNNIFTKLIGHNVDFVGGLYAVKKQGVRRSASIASNGLQPVFDSGLQEMRWLSTGCWCVKREVVRRMIEAYPELKYDGDDNAAGKTLHALYLPMLYDLKPDDFPNVQLPMRKMLSEDWSFCNRWRAIGGKLYADTSIVLKHIGKFDYTLYDVEVVKTQKPNSIKPNLPLPGFDL